MGKSKQPMNWITAIVADGLRYRTPQGYHINEKALLPIARRLIATGGTCPCHHEEWDAHTPEEDKACPCKTFRDPGDCHCGLYCLQRK